MSSITPERPDVKSVADETKPSTGKTTCTVIVNRESGTVKDVWSADFKNDLQKVLEEGGWEPRICEVQGQEIESTVKEAKRAKVGAIIAGGGDGTTNSIVSMMLGSDTPLGILPFGTLNLAPRDLGSPLDPLEAAASLRPDAVKKIDVLKIGGHACLCMAVFGFYPKLLSRSESFHGRNWLRKFTGLAAVFFKAFTRGRSLKLSVQDVDSGTVRNLSSRMLFLIPGTYEDNLGIIPKRNSLEAGMCSIVYSEHRSRWSLFRLVCNFLMGRSREDPDLDIAYGSQFEIKARGRKKLLVAIDGELKHVRTPVDVALEREALRVLYHEKSDS
ncbi:diacylglycerol kinase family protein [Pelagicoccus sp. SDUM812002]|uniref:diacylglycerol/lipid kinase family protein n=1 Tax=Pelagicoccus sp. SDUM812002 TaxID=3041266 RepID=UPI00280DE2A5|nr:diacylglycerol kinase family protein [Pelagicoccus sp. SDUM812002]MDQ8187621.1 diacylglycerol kinase family protein [Pelagicoccus sp. SDUM812002]